jgi:molecular chaperone Hsp33
MIIANDDNYLVRATAFEGKVRALAVNSTNAVRELARLQATAPAATAALGRVATAALLLGSTLKKGSHLVTVQVRGGGPARHGPRLGQRPGRGPRPGGQPAAGRAGDDEREAERGGRRGDDRPPDRHQGPGLREPYNSTVELVSGEIGKDFAHYFARSEQVPSAVGLGVFVDRAGGGGRRRLHHPGAGRAVGRRDRDIEREVGRCPTPPP